MFDAVVISDVHLGSDNCQAKYLVHFLSEVRRGTMKAKQLILNGDMFDSIDFRRLKKLPAGVILSGAARQLSDEMEVVWINGNHDGPAEIVSHLLGVECADEIIVESGGRKILFLHGHRFDQFISRYPLITWMADRLYNFLQKIDKSHHFAKLAKRKSKTFLQLAAAEDRARRGKVRGEEGVRRGLLRAHAPAGREYRRPGPLLQQRVLDREAVPLPHGARR